MLTAAEILGRTGAKTRPRPADPSFAPVAARERPAPPTLPPNANPSYIPPPTRNPEIYKGLMARHDRARARHLFP